MQHTNATDAYLTALSSSINLKDWIELDHINAACKRRGLVAHNSRPLKWRTAKGVMHIMPRKKSTTSTTKYVNKGFINVTLSLDDRKEYLEWSQNSVAVYAALEDYCDEGRKISLAQAKNDGSYLAAMTCSNDELDDYGYCVTAYARTPGDALAVAMYKWRMMAHGNFAATWGQASDNGPDFG